MRLVFDIETTGLQLHAITAIHCICMTDLLSGEKWDFYGDNLSDCVEVLNSAHVLIGHNIVAYDLPILRRFFSDFKDDFVEVVDTQLLSRILYPDREKGHSLASYGAVVGTEKVKHEDWSTFSMEMLHRCRVDVDITCDVYRHLIAQVSEYDYWHNAIKLEHKVAQIIQEQVYHGWLFDTQKAYGYVNQLESSIAEIDQQLDYLLHRRCVMVTEIAKPFTKDGSLAHRCKTYKLENVSGPLSVVKFEAINLSSDKQMKELLLELGWIPTQWNYKKDSDGKLIKQKGELVKTSPKLTEDSYESLPEGLGQLLAMRLKSEHRLSQIRGLIANVRPDGRIEAQAITCGTNTARMTHRGVVNIPKAKETVFFGKELRSLFIVPKDKVLVGVDATALEARCLAHYIGDDKFTEELLASDIHTVMQKLAGLKTRDQAKTLTYACVPMDTQILTKKGWKRYDEISIGDAVISYNPVTSLLEDDQLLEKVFYEDAPIVEIKHSKCFKFRCTPNHRWFVRRRTGKKIRYYVDEIRETKDLNSECNIIIAAKYQCRSTRKSAYNTKYESNWLEEILKMSYAERMAFMNGFLLADGHCQGEHKAWLFSQLDGGIFEAALLCAFLNGHFLHVTNKKASGKTEKSFSSYKDMKIVHIAKRAHTTSQRTIITEVGNAAVWCPRTKNGSWIARQGDMITITGNTIYGAGDGKLGKIVGGNEQEGVRLRHALYKKCPGLERLITDVKTAARMKRWILAIDQRKLFIRSEHSALNVLLQGCGAILMKVALTVADKAIKRYKLDAHFVGNFHDEMQIETTPMHAEKVLELVQESIKKAGLSLGMRCPMDAEGKIGTSWDQTH